ncbi:hypothetical protein MXAN_5283 [Myxococcus xanthus DK 1622]|uniref:Uncharacterized protein n=1 Tax=Myxococcus xanthus (strain DK1622) TaxID=246197 RepID=Q1D1N8_MYXXD|nr:hypothetical protein MXAN_5283 [Myxococcus xanthus DK 1622]
MLTRPNGTRGSRSRREHAPASRSVPESTGTDGGRVAWRDLRPCRPRRRGACGRESPSCGTRPGQEPWPREHPSAASSAARTPRWSRARAASANLSLSTPPPEAVAYFSDRGLTLERQLRMLHLSSLSSVGL